jgi:predicted TIM-barrel fold metal-dependent hydrolase
MTLIDTNAYLGHFAARRLHHNTPEGLLALMDRAGIARACVSSASAICYRNSHAGNEEMWEALEGTDALARLIPFAVINPAYAAWETDLRWCRETMGAKGVRIYPTWHNYKLGDGCCHALAEAAGELGMVVSIPQRVEDYRQRHWLLDTPDVNLNEMAALAAAHSNTKFLVTNAAGVGGSDFVTKKDDRPANYWVDVCRPDIVYTKEAERLVESLGEDRIVFGSCIPFCYPEPATVRMEVLKDLGCDVGKIGYETAKALLNL